MTVFELYLYFYHTSDIWLSCFEEHEEVPDHTTR